MTSGADMIVSILVPLLTIRRSVTDKIFTESNRDRGVTKKIDWYLDQCELLIEKYPDIKIHNRYE